MEKEYRSLADIYSTKDVPLWSDVNDKYNIGKDINHNQVDWSIKWASGFLELVLLLLLLGLFGLMTENAQRILNFVN